MGFATLRGVRAGVALLLVVAGCTARAPGRDTAERADAGGLALRTLAAASVPVASPAPADSSPPTGGEDPTLRAANVVVELHGHKPHAWGQTLEGVLTRFESDTNQIALTLDACGGPGGNGYDAQLIEYLRDERVAATLFVTAKWIAANRDVAQDLSADPLFELENHGDRHKPCSVDGRSAYDIRGTRSVSEAVDEIAEGAIAIEALTGRWPRFFRPGTAYFDDVCVDVVKELGAQPMGYSVAGDAGGGFGRAEVAKQVGAAPSGSVVLVHMNKPRGATAEGLRDAIPKLRARGFSFVRLDQVTLR